MRKLKKILALSLLFSSLPLLANVAQVNSTADKPCMRVAKACMNAGYVPHDPGNKKLGVNCVKPLVEGKTVSGVTVDANTLTSCRAKNKSEIKKEVEEAANSGI